MSSGILYGLGAYFTWGLLPIYWSFLKSVSPLEILLHRILWSFLIVSGLMFFWIDWKKFSKELKDKRSLYCMSLSTCLLTINWGLYIWAVNNNKVLETSLGYFMSPLFSILIGIVFFGERLSLLKNIAVGIVSVVVLCLALTGVDFPWVAVFLALSFSIYALLRKRSKFSSVEGLFFETGLLFLPSLLLLSYWHLAGNDAFGFYKNFNTSILLIGTGFVTAVPLLLFTSAVKKLPMSTFGMMQYLLPTLQFLLGIFWFREEINSVRLVAFILIWVAIGMYVFDEMGREKLRISLEI